MAHRVSIESKRYEPWGPKSKKQHSSAYERDVWGTRMTRYQATWEAFIRGETAFGPLDVAQLMKHAPAIRTRINAPRDPDRGRHGILYYLHADPVAWPDGSALDGDVRAAHRRAIDAFAAAVAGDEVRFVPVTYAEVFASWRNSGNPDVIAHAGVVESWAGLATRSASFS